MKTFCIDKPVVERMKNAVKSGEINIKGLYEMTSAERHGVFEKYSSKELAQHINAAFEKAMISKQQGALKTWAEAVFTPKQKQTANYKNLLDKINELDKMGVLNPKNSESFMSDLVADKLGVSVSAQEVKTISDKAQKLEKLFAQQTDDGLPPVEYWVERKSMENYIQSLTPSSSLRVMTSIAGRGAMLLSIKSPVTNIISNTVQGLMQAFEKRVASNTYVGLNGDFAVNYVKKVNDIYQKSGYDISRMETFSQDQRRLGEEMTSSQGPGPFRAIGRWYEDIVFKQLMGAPDVASSSIAFADSANLASTQIANSEKLSGDAAKKRALEIFKDAVLIKPQTLEGEIVRSQAIADATYATYTNKGQISDLAMGIRTVLNKATGDIRLGDNLMPFVKTPANVVQAGMESSGITLPVDIIFKLPEARRQAQAGNGEPMRQWWRHMIRAGLGFTGAVILAYTTKPDDFVGAYESVNPKDKSLAHLKNAPFNSVKIGDKWISLDYFGPLAAPYVGIMYARKYGEGRPVDTAFQYGRGVVGQFLRTPGFRELNDLVKGATEVVQRGDLGESVGYLSDELVAYIRARTIPAIVNDYGQATDPNQRQTGRNQLSKTQAAIPGARQKLPLKLSQITGEPMKGEGFVQTLLFGSRVKTSDESPLVKEINRLYGEGAGPTISNVEYASKRMKELQNQIGNYKFQEAIEFYGKRYGRNAGLIINRYDYKRTDDEGKKNLINKVRRATLEDTLIQFRYKRPR